MLKESKLGRILAVMVFVIPFILFDVFLRYYVGKTVLDGVLGEIFPVLFDVLWIGMICTFCMSLPNVAGKIVYIAVLLVFSIWTFANYIYHCIFKQYLWISDISMASEGGDYIGVVFDYTTPFLLILTVVVLVLCAMFVCRYASFKFRKKGMAVSALLAVCIALADGIFVQIAENELKNGRWEIWQGAALI